VYLAQERQFQFSEDLKTDQHPARSHERDENVCFELFLVRLSAVSDLVSPVRN